MLNLKIELELELNEIFFFKFLVSLHACRLDNYEIVKRRFFQLSLHKRQQYFSISSLINKKIITLSTGQIIKPWVRVIKYYKKDRQNIGLILAAYKHRFIINNIGLLFCKNYNYRQYLWLKKYNSIVNPHISYIIFTRSWPYSPKGIRRIKKNYYKEIFKKQISINK